MRNGKNPTLEQKKILKENNKNPENWLLIKTYINSYKFRHKDTGTTIELPAKSK